MPKSLVTAPTIEPVTVPEAKDHCRITIDAEDDQVEAWIARARRYFEKRTGRQLITATWDAFFDAFPIHYWEPIELPLAPLQSVTSVTYVDEDGTTQTWSSSLYDVRVFSGDDALPGLITPKSGQTYPTARHRHPNAVTVRFVAGYGVTAETVPEDIRGALKEMVEGMFVNRSPVLEGEAQAVPWGAEDVIQHYRVHVIP